MIFKVAIFCRPELVGKDWIRWIDGFLCEFFTRKNSTKKLESVFARTLQVLCKFSTDCEDLRVGKITKGSMMVRKLQELGREGTHGLRYKKGRRRIRRELQERRGGKQHQIGKKFTKQM